MGNHPYYFAFKMRSFLYVVQNRILKKLFHSENIPSHKNMKKHSQMVEQYNVSKATVLK